MIYPEILTTLYQNYSEIVYAEDELFHIIYCANIYVNGYFWQRDSKTNLKIWCGKLGHFRFCK